MIWFDMIWWFIIQHLTFMFLIKHHRVPVSIIVCHCFWYFAFVSSLRTGSASLSEVFLARFLFASGLLFASCLAWAFGWALVFLFPAINAHQREPIHNSKQWSQKGRNGNIRKNQISENWKHKYVRFFHSIWFALYFNFHSIIYCDSWSQILNLVDRQHIARLSHTHTE